MGSSGTFRLLGHQILGSRDTLQSLGHKILGSRGQSSIVESPITGFQVLDPIVRSSKQGPESLPPTIRVDRVSRCLSPPDANAIVVVVVDPVFPGVTDRFNYSRSRPAVCCLFSLSPLLFTGSAFENWRAGAGRRMSRDLPLLRR
ncbi:hypothetical protein chiPu_0019702 [Chiloscyllium punctatum]|uniref:Uncharacterized protein n=1 Tax=Chiloscyllium punctatum TaxID=137246 RepID=A0A401RSV8_CHIPU|nr:hypothetical protein [Chiloscyllium punctatum]